MKRSQPRAIPLPSTDGAARDYLFDMIGQMAKLARENGEEFVAVHLEAIMKSWTEMTRQRST